MTFAIAHNYLTVHWTVPNVPEGGQFGLRFDGPALTAQSDVDAIATSTKTWWQLPTTNIQPNYNLSFVKVARINLNGDYVPGAPVWVGAVAQPALSGGTGGIQFPLQVATVATLRTAVSVGLAHAGRIYLPPLSGLLSSTQQWSTSMVNAANNALATHLSILSGGPLGNLNVMSFGNAAITVGPAHLVTATQMDCRPDVQRRRAAQLVPVLGTTSSVL
jgi:hypothetical protein